VKKYIPWYMKIAIKLAVGNIPGMQKFTSGILPIFQQGPRKDPHYNINVYFQHFRRFVEFNRVEVGIGFGDYNVLELGPGKSLGSGIVAYILGAKKVYLVDVEKWARIEDDFIREIMDRLKRMIETSGLLNSDLDIDDNKIRTYAEKKREACHCERRRSEATSFSRSGNWEIRNENKQTSLLPSSFLPPNSPPSSRDAGIASSQAPRNDKKRNSRKIFKSYLENKVFSKEKIISRINEVQNEKNMGDYLLNNCLIYSDEGMETLGKIPGKSIAFTFSQAVLEHVNKDEFKPLLDYLYKITIPGGITSHVVDLRDHIGNSLHSLRFCEKTWESDLFRNSGFYTNRMRKNEIIKLFEESGWEIVCKKGRMWDKIPLKRKKLAPEFSNLPDDDLRCSGLVVVGRKGVL